MNMGYISLSVKEGHMSERNPLKPGVCHPWEEKRKEYETIRGDEDIVKQQHEFFDEQLYQFLWFMVEHY